MRIILTAMSLVATLMSSAPTRAEMTPQTLLVASNFAGFCGTMLALADFSDQTKLAGSRDFVTRLWASEAARLGYQDAKALLAMCRQSFRTYSAVQSNSDRLAGTAFGEARLSGSCGVFTHMLAFHQATNMPNGDAIIEGFVRSEATNAGHTFGSYLKACVKAHLLYDELLKAF